MIIAVIPFKDRPELTVHVLELLAEEPDVRVLLMDDGSALTTIDQMHLRGALSREQVTHLNAAHLSFYERWDVAWGIAHDAAEGKPYEVAFLNNDIDFLPGTLGAMRDHLREGMRSPGAVCPDYDEPLSLSIVGHASQRRVLVEEVHGSYRVGGLAGWCFMVRGELRGYGIRPDPSYRWWAGDDDLFAQIETSSFTLGILRGLPLDHVGEATARHHAWTHEAKQADLDRFRKKWGAA